MFHAEGSVRTYQYLLKGRRDLLRPSSGSELLWRSQEYCNFSVQEHMAEKSIRIIRSVSDMGLERDGAELVTLGRSMFP